MGNFCDIGRCTMEKLRILVNNYWKNALPADAGGRERFFAALNLLLPVFTGIYVFLNPMPLPALSEMVFYPCVAALVILLLFKKTDFTLNWPLTWSFALFSIWAIIGLFRALDLTNSLHDIRGHLLEHLIIFYLLVNYFNSKRKLEALSLIIIASMTVFSLGAIVQYYWIEGFPFSQRLGISFLDMSTNNIGFVIISMIPLALNGLHHAGEFRPRLIFLVCIIILCLTALLTQSRASVLGLFIGIIIFSLNNKKFVFLLIAVIIFIALVPGIKDRIIREDSAKDNRIKINRLTLEIIKEHPVTGIGFGMQIYGNESLVNLKKYNSRLPEEFQQNPIMPSPHNTLLDIAVRTGIIGLVIYLSALLTAVFMLWKTYRVTEDEHFKSWAMCLSACFTASTFVSLFQDTTFGARAIIHFTILAMITILWKLSKITAAIEKKDGIISKTVPTGPAIPGRPPAKIQVGSEP
jgi:O-antigen ligase